MKTIEISLAAVESLEKMVADLQEKHDKLKKDRDSLLFAAIEAENALSLGKTDKAMTVLQNTILRNG